MKASKRGPGHLDRRDFVRSTAAVFTAISLGHLKTSSVLALGADRHRTANRINDIFLDITNVHKWDQSNGDTWDPFWADDDNLYAFNCDGRGFGTQKRNLALNRLQGDAPHSLIGTIVNSMDEYGAAGAKAADNATWKVCGQECIDSVFYAFISRNVYGSDSKDPLMRQTACNSSLIKSVDRGQTWSRSAGENYRRPVWLGGRFGSRFFIHYGKNGGKVDQDEADKYVYAISPNGFWNDGDNFVIGRVERAKLPDLNSSDWRYYSGGDGQRPTAWSREIGKAAIIFSRPGKCGQTPICYIPSLNIYLMISWYNPAKLTKWFEPNEMKYDFYQAERPWGPWEFINSHTDNFIGAKGHMYGPSLCAKFQRQTGRDVRVSLFTSGCPFEDVSSGLYKLWQIPILLRTSPMPASTVIDNNSRQIAYKGNWHSLVRGKSSGEEYDVRYTTTVGDSAELAFTGTGIEYIAEKGIDLGNVEVYLDGALKENVVLRLNDFPRLSRIVVFAIFDLSQTNHVIKLVNNSTAYGVLAAFKGTEMQ